MLEKIIGLYRWKDKRTAEGTDDITFEGPEVGRDEIVKLTFASILDYSTGNKQLILAIRDVEKKDHYIVVRKSTNEYEIMMEGEIFLLPGEKPVGIVASPANGNVCYFSAYGIIYELSRA